MGTPLFRQQRLREIEKDAAAGLPVGTLMQRAGEVAAAWIARSFSQARRTIVVCGPGNNGGDGYVCATALRAVGRAVECVALAPPATDDARAAAARWDAAGGRTHAALDSTAEADLGIDAMFGIGLARPLAGPYLEAAEWLNRRTCVALDVPSGLDADTGAWVGRVAGVRAAATITFLGAKPGLFTADGADACGQVVVDGLGIRAAASDGALVDPSDFAAVCRPRPRNTHKGRFGNVAVIGGAAGMVGAALLAARGALRLGAGRVYVDTLAGTMDVDPTMPELMFRATDTLDEPRVTVLGCGLGTSEQAAARLSAALARPDPCVLDADALNLVAAEVTLRNALAARSTATVLTPHPLEAARLLGSSAAEVQADRVSAARHLAASLRAIVVLKGAGSVVATPERWWISPTGTPALSTAGSGDVLAGMIGALLAQGFEPAPAVLAAVWLHGRAADEFGADLGLVAGEIAPRAASALAKLRAAAAG